MNERYQADSKRYGDMQYRYCGASGLKLSAISLGLWNNFSDNDKLGNMKAMLFKAFDLGITHFDIANNYGPPPGAAERNFGIILKEDLAPYRDELIISSKAGYTMWDGPYGDFGSRKYLIASIDQSLKRTGLEYFDIFYHHRFDANTPLEETAYALGQIVRSGKALYVGISNYNGEQLEKMKKICDADRIPLIIHQPSYSMINRNIEENGAKESAYKEGMGTIAFCPLEQGLLTSKYLGGDIPADSRAAKKLTGLETRINGETVKKIKKLDELAKSRGQTLAQMALSWILKDDKVTSVLIGASKVEQIVENVEILKNLAFSEEQLKLIDSIARS